MRSAIRDDQAGVIRTARRLVAWLALLASGLTAEEVGFHRAEYTVVEGGQIEVRVEIEPLAQGELFSFGVRLLMSGEGKAEVTDISVPPELDFNGFAAGAMTELDPAVLGARGNRHPNGEFTGRVLATFTLQGIEAGPVDLGLALYRLLGASDDVFVASGVSDPVLDDLIQFGTARLTVAPSPVLEIAMSGDDEAVVSYAMEDGIRYFLFRSEDLVDWTPVAETVRGAAPEASFTFPVDADGRSFFRLEAQPNTP